MDPDVILAPEHLIAKMRSAEKVFFVTTPTFLKRFCAYADQYEVPQNCVEIVTSGALLDAETSAAAKRVFGIAPQEIFGSTETGGVAWRRQGGENAGPYDWTVFDPVDVRASADGRLVVNSPFSFQKDFVMGMASRYLRTAGISSCWGAGTVWSRLRNSGFLCQRWRIGSGIWMA